jgi:hypothetical protein
VTSILVILAIVFLAWRYRRSLGLDQRWDRYGRSYADELSEKLGWSTRRGGNPAPDATVKTPVTPGPERHPFLPTLDTTRLPTAVAAGVLVAIIAVALDVQGWSLLASLVGIVIGPFAGGTYIRSRWWVLVAPAVAVVVGAGGELSPLFVAVPVAAIAYGGIRTDVGAWLARLDTGSEGS